MAKLIKAFLHVAIKAPGLEAFKEACNFYENVLGLEPLSHWGEGLDTYQMYDFGNGGTIELSADAPMREPYLLYMQGGLTYEYGKLGVMRALDEMLGLSPV